MENHFYPLCFSHEGCEGEADRFEVFVSSEGEFEFVGQCKKCKKDFSISFTMAQLIILVDRVEQGMAREGEVEKENPLFSIVPMNKKPC